MQFLPILALLNHFIQLCIPVPFLLIDSCISMNYHCYNFWLGTKLLLVGKETTSRRQLLITLAGSEFQSCTTLWPKTVCRMPSLALFFTSFWLCPGVADPEISSKNFLISTLSVSFKMDDSYYCNIGIYA